MKNVELDGIDMSDYPKFCDAHITYAEHEDGTPYTEEELEEIDMAVVHDHVISKIF